MIFSYTVQEVVKCLDLVWEYFAIMHKSSLRSSEAVVQTDKHFQLDSRPPYPVDIPFLACWASLQLLKTKADGHSSQPEATGVTHFRAQGATRFLLFIRQAARPREARNS